MALENNELFLAYQPILNLISSEIVEVEVLLRWNHPVHGLVAPEYFIPIAEETGLIIPIGQWVIQKACQEYKTWPIASNKCRIALNISSLELRHNNFIELVSSILLQADIPPYALTLEIAESIASDELEEARNKLETLQQMGILLSIDDFGTGYSSLSRLKQFPIHTLKIDKSFIKNIINDQSNELIVRSTITLAKDLGLNVIAEGVETEEQVQFLIANKCPLAQGFYFSQPIDSNEIIKLLKKQLNI